MKIAIGITGASGAIYAQQMLQKLKQYEAQFEAIQIVWSDNAKTVWEQELGHQEYEYAGFKTFEKNDFFAPFASGSAGFDALVIIPCSMGTMGRIANGMSDSLITRAADVMLKERKKLILVVRETPYNLIHINNMKLITEAGGIICPASPSFYSLPKTFEALADTVVDRVLSLLNIKQTTYEWGKDNTI